MALDPMTRGDDREIAFQLTVSSTDPTPRPFNAGELLRCTGKKRFGQADADAVFRKSSAVGTEISCNPTTGAGLVYIAAADTIALPNKPITLEVDLQLTEVSGKIRTIKRDTLEVLPEVTRAPETP